MSLPKSGLFQATSAFHWRYFFGEASKFISPPSTPKKKTRTTRKIAPLHQLQDQGLSGAVNVNAEDSAFQRAPRLVGVCRFKRCFPLERQQYFCWRFKRLSHLGEHPAIWHLFAAVRIAPRWHGRSIPHGPTCPSASLGTSNFNPKKKLQLVKMPPWGPPSRNHQLGPVD